MTQYEIEIAKKRDFRVCKANEIIQRARFDLGLIEQKTFCYLVSKIRPTDTPETEYELDINDYCDVVGISRNDGRTIQHVKKALKGLRDKSFYLLDEKGDYILIGWLSKAKVSPKCGKIRVKFDDDMHKYLHNLFERGRYTQYTLICILPMRSAYSIRLYELLKSYAKLGQKTFTLDEIKQILNAKYERFPDFRRKVLEVAEKEINEYTDIAVTWNPICKGRKVTHIEFSMRTRTPEDAFVNWTRGQKKLMRTSKYFIENRP